MEVFILKDVFNFLTILQRDPAQLEFLLDSKTSLDTGDGRKKLRGVLDNCKDPIHPTEVFDFIVGTSVGSIIAFGLVGGKKSKNKRERVPMEVEEIILMFKDSTKKMFEKKVRVNSWISWFKDKFLAHFLPFPSIPYSQDGLEECLKEHFGDIYLEGFPKPRGCVAGAVARHFFNTGVSGKMVLFTTKSKNDNYKVVDVLKASSAAPIYFQTPVVIGEDDYIDGGDGGNCPLAQALPAVKEILGEDVKVSTVLSFAPPRTFLGPIPAENQWSYWLGYFPTRVTDGSSVYDRVSNYSPQDITFQRLFPKSDEARKFKLDDKNVDTMISCMEEESIKDKSYFTDIIQAALTITLRLDKPDNNARRQICEKVFNSSENEELTLLWLKVAEHEVAPSNEIAQIRRKLGDCYYKRNYYDKAIRCYQKSMEECDQHPEDMAVLNNRIGACYKAKDCFNEAVNFFQKNLQLTTSPLVIAESYNHLGDCHDNLGRVDLAIPCYTKALDHIEKAQKSLGQYVQKEASNFIANSYNGLGNCYLKENKLEKALEYYSKNLETPDAVDGMSDVNKEHRSIALNNMGLCYLMIERFRDAISNFKKSLDLKKDIHGRFANHPTIAISHTNLGNGYLATGEYDNAIENFRESLDMNIKIYGKDSAILCMAETFNNLGICFLRKPGEMDSLDEVVNCFKKSLHIQKTVFGKDSQQQSIAKSYNNLGRSLMLKHQYDDAIKKLNKSLDVKIQIFGDDPEIKSIAITYTNLGECCQQMGNNSKAKDYFDQVKIQVEEHLEEHFY